MKALGGTGVILVLRRLDPLASNEYLLVYEALIVVETIPNLAVALAEIVAFVLDVVDIAIFTSMMVSVN
jgi:hypothetical protein